MPSDTIPRGRLSQVAELLVGGRQNKEDPDKAGEVARATGRRTVKFKSVEQDLAADLGSFETLLKIYLSNPPQD